MSSETDRDRADQADQPSTTLSNNPDLWAALWRRHGPPRRWQRHLRKGDHAEACIGDTTIVVEILEDPGGDPKLTRQRRLVRAYSRWYPQGETGLMYITDMVRPLNVEDFEHKKLQHSLH